MHEIESLPTTSECKVALRSFLYSTTGSSYSSFSFPPSRDQTQGGLVKEDSRGHPAIFRREEWNGPFRSHSSHKPGCAADVSPGLSSQVRLHASSGLVVTLECTQRYAYFCCAENKQNYPNFQSCCFPLEIRPVNGYPGLRAHLININLQIVGKTGVSRERTH